MHSKIRYQGRTYILESSIDATIKEKVEDKIHDIVDETLGKTGASEESIDEPIDETVDGTSTETEKELNDVNNYNPTISDAITALESSIGIALSEEAKTHIEMILEDELEKGGIVEPEAPEHILHEGVIYTKVKDKFNLMESANGAPSKISYKGKIFNLKR